MTTLTIDVTDITPEQVADLLARLNAYRGLPGAGPDPDAPASDAQAWEHAESTGWTLDHVEQLRAHLSARGNKVQLAAFDRAIEHGGFITREEVYKIGNYLPTRKLNNWTAPLNRFSETLVDSSGLPEDAEYPITTEYGEGVSFRPAIGFSVAAEIVKLVREQQAA